MSVIEQTGLGAEWELHEVDLALRWGVVTVRMLRARSRWVASVTTNDGATIGCDVSPYLAVHRALEPLDTGLAEVLEALPRELTARG